MYIVVGCTGFFSLFRCVRFTLSVHRILCFILSLSLRISIISCCFALSTFVVFIVLCFFDTTSYNLNVFSVNNDGVVFCGLCGSGILSVTISNSFFSYFKEKLSALKESALAHSALSVFAF